MPLDLQKLKEYLERKKAMGEVPEPEALQVEPQDLESSPFNPGARIDSYASNLGVIDRYKQYQDLKNSLPNTNDMGINKNMSGVLPVDGQPASVNLLPNSPAYDLAGLNLNSKAPVNTSSTRTSEIVRQSAASPSSNKIQSSPNLKDIDFGQGDSIASAENLARAQQLASEGELLNTLGKAGSLIGASIAGAKPGVADSIFDANIKSAQSLPEKYQEQVKFEKEDPNSPMSRGYKELAKAMGYNITGKASASDLEKLIPQLANMYTQEEARKARAEMAQLSRESEERQFKQRALDRAAMLQTTLSNKKDQILEKRIDSARKELASATIQKAHQSYLTADRMERSINEFKKNPSGYSDYATLMGGLKTLQGDESVVREAEIRLGMNAGSLVTKVGNFVDQIATGKSLQPKQRDDIIKTVEIMKNIAKSQYLTQIQPIVKSANRRGLPAEELLTEGVINDLNALESKPSSARTVVKKGYNKSTNQTQLVYSDGSKETVNGKR